MGVRVSRYLTSFTADTILQELAVNSLLVMSMEASTSVAPYARLCQAAHLLGRVCTHVNRHASSGDADLHFQEASQLSRALLALMSMLYDETTKLDSSRRHTLFGARALAYSALSTLYDVHSCVEGDELECVGSSRGLRLDLQQQAIDGVKQLLTSVSGFAAEIEQFVLANDPAKVSPFVTNVLYTIAGTFAWYYRENGSEAHLASLGYLKRVIMLLEPQWAVSGKHIVYPIPSHFLLGANNHADCRLLGSPCSFASEHLLPLQQPLNTEPTIRIALTPY